MSATSWDHLKIEFLASSGRDFERKVFPWLKLIEPQLVLPTGLKDLDKKGLDIGYVVPGKSFPLVIQCKGFEVDSTALDKNAIKQVANSVSTFLKKKLRCEKYILLYNRGGGNKNFRVACAKELERLIGNQVKKVSLWSLDDLIKQLGKTFPNKLIQGIQDWSKQLSDQHTNLFHFKESPQSEVPIYLSKWSLGTISDVGKSPSRQELSKQQATTAILKPGVKGWTLVVGEYGMGKSTFIRHLSLPTNYTKIIVPASELRHVESGGGSENDLMRFLLKFSHCLEPLSHQSGIPIDELEKVGGSCLAGILRNPKSKFVLIIDGIDENRVYSKADGWRLLTNELRRTQAPVVITTRTEHFLNHYIDLNADKRQISAVRQIDATVIELGAWSIKHCLSFIEDISQQSPVYSKQLVVLKNKLTEGKLNLVSQHPLWLAMAVDLALNGVDSPFESAKQLYEKWSVQKLMRDVMASQRDLGGYEENPASYVNHMDKFMSAIAAQMCISNGVSMELIESITESQVSILAKQYFHTSHNLTDAYSQLVQHSFCKFPEPV